MNPEIRELIMRQNVHYETSNPFDFFLNGRNLAHKWVLENNKELLEIKLNDKPEYRSVRDQLLKLMKSDVIRINDKNYMRNLSKRLEENYQNEQEKILNELAEKEKKRERNLIAHGLIDEPYDS